MKANKNIVDTVVNDAIAKRDPSVLAVLNDINAGSGPLGNIGWVKDAVRAAEDHIADLVWEEETRAYTRQERERAETARTISGDAFRSILADPFGDHSQWMQAAIDSGNPELISSMRSLQNGVLDDIYKVRTNHEAYADIRYRIYSSSDPEAKSKIAMEILRGTGTLWNKSDAESLMDALEASERNTDVLDDSAIKRSFSQLDKAIRSRFGQKDFMGNPVGGDEEAITAYNYAYDELMDWLADNPDASRQKVRKAFMEIVDNMLNRPEFTNPNAAIQPRKVGEVPNPQVEAEVSGVDTEALPDISLDGSNPDQVRAFGRLLAEPEAVLAEWGEGTLTPEQIQLINKAATAMGMSAASYLERYGGL